MLLLSRVPVCRNKAREYLFSSSLQRRCLSAPPIRTANLRCPSVLPIQNPQGSRAAERAGGRVCLVGDGRRPSKG
jgi:hypothetical protein